MTDTRRTRHDWRAVERALLEEGLTVPEAALRFSIPKTTLYNHARRKGWALPEAPRGGRRVGVDPSTEDILERLKRVAHARIEALEADAVEASETPEPHMRAMERLLKLVERMDVLIKTRAKRVPARLSPQERARRFEEVYDKVVRMIEQIRGAPLPD
ncbi:MAG: helix-turn-helix domain-containing protein [Parvibaculaceae bacterium]